MGLNLAHYLDVAAAEFGGKTAVMWHDRRMSYTELATAAKKVATVIAERGIKEGDKVAVMVPNIPEFLMIYYGILRAGAVVVSLNFLLKSHEIEYHLEDSEAKLLFAWAGLDREFAVAFEATDTCHDVVLVDTPQHAATAGDYQALSPLMARATAAVDTVETMPNDTAVILYTSGTTGHPKGAELTHFNMFFNALCVRERVLKIRSEDVCLVVLPLFHSFGQTCQLNAAVLAGATMTMMDAFDARKMVEIIKRDRVTFMAAVPSIYRMMANMKHLDKADLGSLRTCVSGGDALPGALLDEFAQRFGIDLIEGYGLTETSPVASFNIVGRPGVANSIGPAIWGCEMKIMRQDQTFADVDEIGEIVIRGPNVMKGYYNRPAATEEAFTDGWLHTGDLGKVNQNGYFFVVDRKKDMLIRNGLNVYPREVEEVLDSHPAVLEAAVVGIPDPLRGEEVKAYVALRAGKQTTEKELIAYCRERLAPYKYPRQIEFRAALPKGPTGKILKRQLRTTHVPDDARGPAS